jgi:hypothetical protein
MTILITFRVAHGDESLDSDIAWCASINDSGDALSIFPYAGRIVHDTVYLLNDDELESHNLTN